MFCKEIPQDAKTPGIWNPLPWFDTVRQDGQTANVAPFTDFQRAARQGDLPAVSWLTPAQQVSDHPPALVTSGQAYVTGVINEIMRSPDWSSTALFLVRDDRGGLHEHVAPPRAPTASSSSCGAAAPATACARA